MKSVSKNLNSNISQQLFYLLVLVLFLRIDLVFENNTPTGGIWELILLQLILL